MIFTALRSVRSIAPALFLSAALAAAPLIVTSGDVQAQANPAAVALTENDRLEFPITHFYNARDLTAAFRAIDAAVATETTTSVMNFEVLALFFSELYRQDPKVMGPTVQFFSRYKNDLNVLPWMSAWLANRPETLAELERLKEAGYVEPHKIITAAPQTDYRKAYPRDRITIDALWTLYYASGNPQDAAMVIETALFDQKDNGGKLLIEDSQVREAIQNYATGSVMVHAAKHPAVMQLLLRLSKSVPPAGKDRLQQMTASAIALSQQAREAVSTGQASQAAPAN